MKKIILASSSPRRSEILSNLNINFIKKVRLIDEQSFKNDNPMEFVKILAYEKAMSVYNEVDKDVAIIGADTIVVYDNKILGKPNNEAKAYQYLKMLSGKMHYVYSGLAIIDKDSDMNFIDVGKTKVFMRNYNDDDIYSYIKTNEPMDKAGAYAIQGYGSVLVDKIEGDYFNVVGLPVSKLIEGFNLLGINYFHTFHSYNL